MVYRQMVVLQEKFEKIVLRISFFLSLSSTATKSLVSKRPCKTLCPQIFKKFEYIVIVNALHDSIVLEWAKEHHGVYKLLNLIKINYCEYSI